MKRCGGVLAPKRQQRVIDNSMPFACGEIISPDLPPRAETPCDSRIEALAFRHYKPYRPQFSFSSYLL